MFERILFYTIGILLLSYLVFLRTCVENPNPEIHQSPDGKTKAELGEYDIPKSDFHRGMVFGVFPYKNQKPVYRKSFDELYAHGVNTVSLNFSWFMNTIYDSTVYKGVADSKNQSPSDEILMQAVDDAHAAGLRVMLFPAIYVMNLSGGEWRGRIKPTDWKIWFQSYRNLVVELASIAEKHKAEFFCIGIELLSTEEFDDEWVTIIHEIRKVYSGKLCYSENWDSRHNNNDWFEELDLLAMNAYYKLADEGEGNPSIDELVKTWTKKRKDIMDWKMHYKKPLIITEIGYCSAEDALAHPWNYLSNKPLDLEEQRLGYEAFFKAWYDDTLFNGVYFYNWEGEGGMFDDSYTPRDKPAAEVLKTWYTKIAEREAEREKELTLKDKEETPENSDDSKTDNEQKTDDKTDENGSPDVKPVDD